VSTKKKADEHGISGEFDLIREVFAPLADNAAARNLQDDAAVFTPPPGREMVVTTDMMTAGVHFRMEDGAQSAAARILASNVSDLAAMGADPLGYTLAIASPRELPLAWFRAFVARLAEDQLRDGIVLMGGDTTRTDGPLCLSVTAFGTVPAGKAVARSGAGGGDDLWVSGTIGDAWLGLRSLNGHLPRIDEDFVGFLRRRFLFPGPRIRLGELLRESASAAIDVSDGLLADVGHVAEASGVSIRLDADAIPISDAGRAAVAAEPGLWRGMIAGGDDYEVAFAAPTEARAEIESWSRRNDLRMSVVGTVLKADEAPGIRLIGPDGAEMPLEGAFGYDHFAADPLR